MSLRKVLVVVTLCLCALSLAALSPAAQGSFQSPYGQQPQQLPMPSSPYPDMNAPSPYGGNQPQQQGYQPQQQGGQPQPPGGYQQQPQGGYQQTPPASGGTPQNLNDVLGQFRLSLQEVAPMAATYSFGMPSLGAQVSIMSVAQAQALAAQKQQFLAMIPQMGGRITDQRQITVGGRPAELVAVSMQNPQMNQQQFVAYNFFLSGVNVWIQVMGPAQSQAQVQQAANLVLQGMQTRQ
ncbi:MAG: hypothetical protein HY794_01855 [Desulfarculus sp.]|nr:hypothetical protein [Desulfarculus sp.]